MFFYPQNSNYKSSSSSKKTKLEKIIDLKNDIIFNFIFISIFIKSILFICLISVDTANGIDFKHAFYSVPPILAYCSFIFIFLSFSYLFKGKLHAIYLVVIDILISSVYIGDIWYFRGYSSFLNYHLFKVTTNLDNLSGSVFSMFRWIDILFIIDIFIAIYFLKKNKDFYKEYKRKASVFAIMLLLSVSYLGYAHYKVDVFERGYANQMLFRKSWSPNQTMSNLTPIGYHVYDVYNYYKDCQTYELTSQEKDEISDWYKIKEERLEDNKYKALFKGKNLLVIQVESLENFVIGQSISGQEITPNLNKLLKNSLYFPNYYEQVYNGTSSDADLMTNTSVYPIRTGSTFFRYPYNSYNSLPNLLEKQGYDTLAIHPEKGSYWNWMPALKSIGFNKCIDSNNFVQDEMLGMGISDGSYLSQVSPIIVKQKKPFYTFLVTLSSHAPFDLPKKYRGLSLEKNLDESKLGGYFQSINYTDKQIGSFLNKLSKEKVLDNSVIVIYGDHTGVHKFYSDEVKKVKPSQNWWVDNENKIPLIIYNRDFKGETIKTIGGQVDLLPTVSYLMGIDEKNVQDTAMGRNLLKTNRNATVLSNKKVIGQNLSEEEKKHLIDGIDVADKIIRSGGNGEQTRR